MDDTTGQCYSNRKDPTLIKSSKMNFKNEDH